MHHIAKICTLLIISLKYREAPAVIESTGAETLKGFGHVSINLTNMDSEKHATQFCRKSVLIHLTQCAVRADLIFFR